MQRWFILHIDQAGAVHRLGPMFADVVGAELRAGRLFWSDLAFCPGLTPGWLRIFDIRVFRDLAPAGPTLDVLNACRLDAVSGATWGGGAGAPAPRTPPALDKEILTTPPEPALATVDDERLPFVSTSGKPITTPGPRTWYAQIGGREQGPMEQRELLALVRSSAAQAPVHVWREGLRNWRLVRSADDLDDVVTSVRLTSEIDALEIETGRNVRVHVRQSLVATVYRRTGDERTFIGTCADISENGIQLEFVPGATLTIQEQLMLDVFPLSRSRVPAFAISGTVVWLSESRRRAGVRFVAIHEAAQRAIAVYVQSRRGEFAFVKKMIGEGRR